MGTHYSHLSLTEKRQIEKWQQQKITQAEMARRLGRSEATISRELRRGQVEQLDSEYRIYHRYTLEASEARKEEQRISREQPLKIGHDYALAEWLVSMIGDKGYSPAAACALLGKTPETSFSVTLSHQTVYKYISSGWLWPLTNDALRYKRSRKRRYRHVTRVKRPPAGTSIERRPEIINRREEAGHWEMDTLEGRRGSRKCVNVLTERVTREEVGTILQRKDAYHVVDMLDMLELKLGTDAFRAIFKSITVDNGSEFADCAGMERSLLRPGEKRTAIYYCHPRYPGERGSNEKQNQILRWFFPKGTDFTGIHQDKVDEVVAWINTYPRKILGWQCSQVLFDEYITSCM